MSEKLMGPGYWYAKHGRSVEPRQTVYIETWVAEEIKMEAARQERSVSWIMQRAWALAKAELRRMPGAQKV